MGAVIVLSTAACPTSAEPSTPPLPPSNPPLPSTRSVTTPPAVTNAQGVPPRVNNLVVGFAPDGVSICEKAWSLVIRVETQGTKAGDPIHLTLTGPNMPPELNGTIGTDLRYAMTLGPFGSVGGSGRFVVTVDKVAGSTAQAPTTNEQLFTCR
jgi:hypothetical protein